MRNPFIKIGSGEYLNYMHHKRCGSDKNFNGVSAWAANIAAQANRPKIREVFFSRLKPSVVEKVNGVSGSIVSSLPNTAYHENTGAQKAPTSIRKV